MNENRMVRTWSLVAVGVCAVGPFAVACGSSNNLPPNTMPTASVGMGQMPPPRCPGYPGTTPTGYPQTAQPGYPPGTQPGYPPPTGQPGYPATAPTGYPPPGTQPPPTGSQTPPGPLAPTDPNSLQGILQGLQNAMQGTVSPSNSGGNGGGTGDLIDLGVKAYALKVAPGMQPEGDELKQTMQQGQHAVMMVTLQAGKCYTLVGFSPPGQVADVDLNLLAPPLYMSLAGQDLTHNNTPAIGSSPSPMCPVIAFPLQYKLDVFARQGSGTVAVRLYSKAKS